MYGYVCTAWPGDGTVSCVANFQGTGVMITTLWDSAQFKTNILGLCLVPGYRGCDALMSEQAALEV